MSADICPECGGPITFSPGDDNVPPITAYYHCPNPACSSGKSPSDHECMGILCSEGEG